MTDEEKQIMEFRDAFWNGFLDESGKIISPNSLPLRHYLCLDLTLFNMCEEKFGIDALIRCQVKLPWLKEKYIHQENRDALKYDHKSWCEMIETLFGKYQKLPRASTRELEILKEEFGTNWNK